MMKLLNKLKAFLKPNQKTTSINYPIYVCFYIAICGLSILSFQTSGLSKPFLLSILLQISFATIFLILLLEFACKKLPSLAQHILSCLPFGLFLAHFTNFFMGKLLDVNLGYLLNFFIGEDISHIYKVFHAINMNQFMMMLIIFSVGGIPFLGFLLYQISLKLSQKKPFRISSTPFIYLLFLTLGSFGILDYYLTKKLSFTNFQAYTKRLPLGLQTRSPNFLTLSLDRGFSIPERTLPASQLLESKPNLYLFIVETFRKDFITPEIAPFIHGLSQNHISPEKTFANANSTQTSWFSIFHSKIPIHWQALRQSEMIGSRSLRLLKNAGYEIHVFSSPDLSYFDMDLQIFGKDRELISSVNEQNPNQNLSSWEKDINLIKDFETKIVQEKYKQGQIFIFFLDAPHSEYSFPLSPPPKFTPFVDTIDYLTINKHNLTPIINRYKNSIAFIDSLIERCVTTLEKENIFKEAIFMITGDHGEEFYEEGALFHGTHLNDYQTNVPIIMKLGGRIDPTRSIMTHIDIFPSIIDHLFNGSLALTDLDGLSVLNTKSPYVLFKSLQNGAKNPTDFQIQSGELTLRGRFLSEDQLYTKPEIEIHSLKHTNNPSDLENKDHILNVFNNFLTVPNSP